MLARIGEPFDSPQHVFEIKWDGVRAVTYIEGGRHRMHGRRRRDLAGRYPELTFLAGLPSGTVLDGELVVLQADGRPDFRAMLSRENGTAARAEAAARKLPVVYVVFDLLYADHESWLDRPLRDRRERLAALVHAVGDARCMLSEGVVGNGLSLFAAVRERGLEGIVGKRLDAPYRPGERSDAWQKIKPVQSVHCLILGYEPDGERDFKSLIIATDFDGELRCVGKVGSGLAEADKGELRQLLFARRTDRPLIDPGMTGRWVLPGLFCTVGFLERTVNGNLRAPVFQGLVRQGGGS
ncbi:MAG: DNA ligase [Planctomycetes bacterium]|nr:DNA ligase [Planctomycetota bacterium]